MSYAKYLKEMKEAAYVRKRLENGLFQWSCDEVEYKPITWQQFRWLMKGLKPEQKRPISIADRAFFVV